MDDIGPIAKASFEETTEMFLKAARHAELDTVKGISANVMCGQEGYFGTNSFEIMLDLEKMKEQMKDLPVQQPGQEKTVDELFEEFDAEKEDVCSRIQINNTVKHVKKTPQLVDDEPYTLNF